MVSIVALGIARGFRWHSSNEQRSQKCKGECSFHRILLTVHLWEQAAHSSGFRFVVTYSPRGKTGYRVCANTFPDWNEGVKGLDWFCLSLASVAPCVRLNISRALVTLNTQ